MKRRVAILISGRGSNMRSLIEAAANKDFPAEISLVISSRADAPGLITARELGVPAFAIPIKDYAGDRDLHEKAIHQALEKASIDIVCLAGYMRLLTPFLVEKWAGRMLNIHPSLLPSFPGLHTHAQALEAGVTEHGCTVHLVTESMDEGPILLQAKVQVFSTDTEKTLAARVLAQEHIIYPQALAHLINSYS